MSIPQPGCGYPPDKTSNLCGFPRSAEGLRKRTATTGKVVRRFETPERDVSALAFSADEKRTATTGKKD
jgi:hypothetical protein